MNEIVKIAQHKGIYHALAAAQAQMGKAIKDANNPAFRSKYADLASVMDACLPALNANGVAVYQPTIDDETGRFVETILAHESGETIKCRVPLIVQKNDMQGYGSAVTYARRYGLMCMAGIAPEDDDGNAAAKAAPHETQRQTNAAPKGAERQAREPKVPTPEQVACESLTNAATLDALAAIWGDLPRDVQRASSVIQAKDARKAALVVPVTDEIPY